MSQRKSKEKVQVKSLPQKEKALREKESRKVKGGGGVPGGVVAGTKMGPVSSQ